ncbi:MAG: hypothetical protein ABFC77_14845 [Thermoguttaceae bacterium]
MEKGSSCGVNDCQESVNQSLVVALPHDPIAKVNGLDFGTRGKPPKTAVMLRQNVMFTAHFENLLLRKVDIKEWFWYARHSCVPF